MDIVEYIKDYTTEEWETIPINIRMRLYATGEYDFYKEDSIEAADEIERLREENKYLTYRLARIDGTYDTMFSVVEAVTKQNAALKEGK